MGGAVRVAVAAAVGGAVRVAVGVAVGVAVRVTVGVLLGWYAVSHGRRQRECRRTICGSRRRPDFTHAICSTMTNTYLRIAIQLYP